MDSMNIAMRIMKRRQQLHISQTAFAKDIGLECTNFEAVIKQVNMIEHGMTTFSISQIERIAKALKISPEWLVYGNYDLRRYSPESLW